MTTLELDRATRAAHIQALQTYFRDQREEEVGELQAGFLLDFVITHIGPSIYNRAIRDAQTHLATVTSELDLTLHLDKPQ